MRHDTYLLAGVLLFAGLSLAPAASTAQHKQSQSKKERTVWNYDGGVFFETDGTLPNGVCFRVYGQMTSQSFFANLKRIDIEDDGTTFRRGSEAVTQFPDSVMISYAIRDQLCPGGLQQVGTRRFMTEEMIENLSVTVYWKHGVDLRPAKNIKLLSSRIDRINAYTASVAADLPRRYQWSYELVVPSAGVPLTDSLAFVFRTPDGRIAARVAARL